MQGDDPTNPFRGIPSVDELLRHSAVADLLHTHSRPVVAAAVRHVLDGVRSSLAGGQAVPAKDELAQRVSTEVIAAGRRVLRRVINATGVVLHTGLGRAVLAERAIEAVNDVARGYSSLEIDLDTGDRGSRTARVCGLLCDITGAPAAAVVNNNAAATLLALHVLASGREVVVSRGQLVEIGGSYRLPDVMAAGGAVLREVGTTNRTRLSDYEAAINERTALLLRVHTSNYRVVGFTEETPIEEIAALAHRHGLPAMDDIGSGAIIYLTRHGLPSEPFARGSLAAGADVVTFSGDKLLGGPQAGIILGRRDIVKKIHASPLMRTYRLDKLTLAALEATLLIHRDPEQAVREIPTLSMLAADPAALARRAKRLAALLRKALPGIEITTEAGASQAGGGSMPVEPLPTTLVRVRLPAGRSADEMARELRLHDPPILVRIREQCLLIDPRTLLDGEASMITDALGIELRR